MADAALELSDGMTDAERHYFQSGGDVSEALSTEHATEPVGPVTPVPASEPPIAPNQTSVAPAAAAPDADDEEGEDTAAAVPDQPGQQPNKHRRRVPFREYKAVEDRAAAAEREPQQMRVNNARVEERLNLLQQALQEPTPPEAEAQKPDPEQDIFGYAKWLEDQLNAVAEKVNGYEQQITTGQAEMERERQYFESLNTYAAHKPDFTHAYNYLMRSRAAELVAREYPQVTEDQLRGIVEGTIRIPQQVANSLRQEERDLYRSAFEGRRDPAADIYRLATMRGYRTPQAPQQTTAPVTPPVTGLATPPPVPARPAAPQAPTGTPTATDVVASIQRGQGAAMSLSNAGGVAADTQLTPQMLAEMSEEQFANLFNELQASGNKQKLMELFGH